MLERLLGPLARRWAWVRTAVRVQERVSEVHGAHLAGAITLSGFLSIFPLLLVGIAVLGFVSRDMADLPYRIISRFGLTGDAAQLVTKSLDTAEQSRRTASIVGIGGLIWSALGVVGSLATALNSVWQVENRPGWKQRLVGLAWLAGSAAILVVSFGLTNLVRLLPGWLAPLGLAAGLAVNVVLFLWTFSVLTNRDVRWRAHLPGAVFGGIGLEVLKALGSIYVPRAVASSSALYGTVGIVFAVLAWLLFFGRLVVYAVALNVVRWEEDHGTVTAEIELPKMPGEVPVSTTRAGEAERPAAAAG